MTLWRFTLDGVSSSWDEVSSAVAVLIVDQLGEGDTDTALLPLGPRRRLAIAAVILAAHTGRDVDDVLSELLERPAADLAAAFDVEAR